MKKIVIYLCVLQTLSCRNTKEQENIIAEVNDIVITKEEVDNLIDQELYQTLQRIYVLRKNATEEIIFQKLLDEEARSMGKSKDQILKEEIDDLLTEKNINEYIRNKKLEERGIPNINNGYRVVNVRSSEGIQLVKTDFKKYLTNMLYDRLKEKNKVKTFLNPPSPPKVFLPNAPILHSYGNRNSNVKLVEISDIECENCRNNFPLYESLFEKYSNRVEFVYTHFSGSATLGATIMEAAVNQNKFREMRNIIFSNPRLKATDTLGYLKLASKAGLDSSRLHNDISDPKIYQLIIKNIEYLHSKHIFGTPTIIINGRLIMDVSNQELIEKIIEDELMGKK